MDPDRSARTGMSVPHPQQSIETIVNLFAEPVHVQTAVEAELGYADGNGKFTKCVPEPQFQAIKSLLESATWTKYDADWRVRVSYKIKDEENHDMLSLSYVDDPSAVQCCKHFVVEPVLWFCGERAINVMVSTRKRVCVPPPHPGTRYSSVTITRFKEYVRNSSAAPGVSWAYRIGVVWEGTCVKGAYAAAPRFTVNITMRRDQSAQGYVACANKGMQTSLARNMHGKVEDMLKAGEDRLEKVGIIPVQGYKFSA
ncbi:hypothetical protein JKP88DRAFT_244984 [Tribonema minus]|uniref:Uncharacterized protein n=1 Tax=Tribonema minus TaxID=303371 RepID=A0A836CG88_9STRA|nr:hypothetical protein JKP88DRAFT_244984 [Tribonema minus]